MSKINIKFEGVDELIAKINKQPVAIKLEAGKIIQTTALSVEKTASSLAPVDTGYLRQHIKSRKINDLSAEVVSSAEYSIYLEMGTRKMAPKPFMRPAVKQEETKLYQKLSNLLKGGLK